jgi:hypothetical protein
MADAESWGIQKEHERNFYRANRDRRLQESKDYYRTHLKKEKRGLPIINQNTFDILPQEFTYQNAASIWKIEKTAAIERINKFLRLFPKCLTKHRSKKRHDCSIILKKTGEMKNEQKTET